MLSNWVGLYFCVVKTKNMKVDKQILKIFLISFVFLIFILLSFYQHKNEPNWFDVQKVQIVKIL